MRRNPIMQQQDFAGFLGHVPTSLPAGGPGRLVLFGPRVGDLRAGILVPRVLGLRNLADLARAAPPADGRPWYGERWIDADGGQWQELDLAQFAQDPDFLQVGA